MSRESNLEEIRAAGAEGSEAEELLAYNETHFDLAQLGPETELPLPDEPFVSCWEGWLEEAGNATAFEVLKRHLPQLSFPIQEGVSQQPGYRRATLQGQQPSIFDGASGLEVPDPDTVELELYSSMAGRVPVLGLHGREQFAVMVQALGKKNEPAPIPESMGALMISGYNNWARIHALKQAWESTPEEKRERRQWSEEFAHIRARKELYQDRFMLLSDGPYSAVPAADLGLSDEEWRAKSLVIRRDHECTHYFTRRLFGSMRNTLLDELIADYAGLVAAFEVFRADWFLLFVGLERYPEYRPGGRLDLYRGDPPLSEGAFRALQALVVRAARNLEQFDRDQLDGNRTLRRQATVVAALAALRLDEISSPQGVEHLSRSMAEIEERMGG